jgi:3-hydroxyisobutyrate dehydrogenase-like beta-hydroxyacid dehydrogenase
VAEIAKGKRVRRFVDLSTTGSQVAVANAAALARSNIVQLDSPVSGGVAGAVKGTLAVMVSGPQDHIDAVKDALAVFGKVFVVGAKPGMAQTMKLANNVLSATALAATAEAVVMGVKAGLDPAVMIDVINAGSGRNTASTDKFPKAILPRTFDAGFATALMLKDVRLCLEEAKALGVPNGVMSAVAQLWETANSEIGGDKDFTTIVQPVERRAGVIVGAEKKR